MMVIVLLMLPDDMKQRDKLHLIIMTLECLAPVEQSLHLR